MKKVYVAHPYGGLEQNKIGVEVIIRKLVAVNPEDLYLSPIHAMGYLYNDVGYEHGMEYCLELLSGCDELLLCEGWENSTGCKIEKKFSETHGINIRIYEDAPNA